MNFKYSINEWPPVKQMLAYGLQWLMLTVPLIIILGKVVAGVQYPQETDRQLIYLQKLFFSCGIVFLAQLLAGHKLPIITGPATVLTAGILTNVAIAKTETIYFSIMAGGAIIALLAISGQLSGISRLFTKRIIGVVLLLIAFTMLPTIINLLAGGLAVSFGQLIFSGVLLIMMLVGQRCLPEFLRSTILVWVLIGGSIAHHLLFVPTWNTVLTVNHSFFWWELLIQPPPSFIIDPGVLISFLFCFLVLVANDVGSIQTTAQLVAVRDRDTRTRTGLIVTGVGNVIAGYFGVIGPVSFSLSTGVILSSKCASRYTLLPAAIGMIILAFTPWIIQAFAVIPLPVIGTLLLYMMCAQTAGGLGILKDTLTNYESGLVVGVPILLGTLIAFLPNQAVSSIPLIVRPLLANGFVTGVIVALFLEHVVFKEPRNP